MHVVDNMRKLILLFIVFCTLDASAQVFLPVSFWGPKRSLSMRCELGCYPTPATPFVAALYYVPLGSTASFGAISLSNPGAYDYCFGPVNGSGCVSGPVYPLTCPGTATGTIDGTAVDNQGDYTPVALGTDTCYVTDYNEAKVQSSVSVQSFNAVNVTAPITSLASPWNMCVTQTRAMTATGGLGTLAWSVLTGPGSVSPLTGTSSTYTATAVPGAVKIQVIDPTTQMPANVFINVSNTMAITPTATSFDIAINSQTKMHYPASAGYTRTANLDFSVNCGVQNYTASCTGGDSSVSPTTGIANAASVYYTPATSTSTSTFSFTDSTPVTPQVLSRPIYNMVPVDVKSSWSYHSCMSYSHSTYGAGIYKLKCWGFNTYGETGNGGTTALGNDVTELGYGLPLVKNSGTTGSDMLIKDFAVGLFHTCAILSNNTVKCWGRNNYGQLGYDNTTTLFSPSATTVNVGVGTPKKIYAAAFRTCLVFSDDRVKCWGRNARGELGQDNIIDYGSNATTASMANLGYISVAGSFLTAQKMAVAENVSCTLTTSTFTPGASKVYCWGYGNNGTCAFGTIPDTNYCGELGRGTSTANWGDGTNLMASLTAVNLGTTSPETIIDVSAGRKHICALIVANAVATAGQPICWGRNNRGQLGIDNSTSVGITGTPITRVIGITTATSVATATEVSCAIMSTNDGRCWGRGGFAQLLGSSNASYTANVGDDTTPGMAGVINMSIGTGLTIKKLATGYAWSCAILSNDFVKCWGAQYCGTGTTTVNAGCLLSGLSATLVNTNPVASPNMMTSRYIGDAAAETGDLLLYINH